MRSALVFSLLAAAACGNDTSAADPIDTDAEAAAVAQHGSLGAALGNAKGVAALFVAEDPTLDPTQSAGFNADAVAAQLGTSTMGCAGAQITHIMGNTMVAISFGNGCTLAPLGTLSGAVSATVTKIGSTITVLLTFSNLTVAGQTLNGTLAASTDNGSVFTYKATVNDGSVKVIYSGTAQLDGAGGVVLSGTGSIDTGATPIDVMLSAVHHTFGKCYADAGSVVETKTVRSLRGNMVMATESITFDASTPSTGMATVAINDVTKTVTLMPYGSCPHP